MAKTSPGRRKFIRQIGPFDPQVPSPAHFEGAVVTEINVGAAADGGDIIKVDWRGSGATGGTTVNGYARSYSPRVVGDNVVLIVQANKIVIFDVIRGVQ